ncbi:hypothetical protein ACFX15_001269 [Malus domestica]
MGLGGSWAHPMACAGANFIGVRGFNNRITRGVLWGGVALKLTTKCPFVCIIYSLESFVTNHVKALTFSTTISSQ